MRNTLLLTSEVTNIVSRKLLPIFSALLRSSKGVAHMRNFVPAPAFGRLSQERFCCFEIVVFWGLFKTNESKMGLINLVNLQIS